MNKKRLFIFTAFILLLFFLMTFAGGSRNNIIATRTVEFIDSFNGETIDSQNIEVGKDASVPENPYHRGFVFGGWFDYDDHNIELTDFTKVIEDIKAIALYADDINNNGIADEDDTRYTVRFIDTITNDVLKTQTVLVGMDASAPSPLAHDGYTFGGWEDGYTNVRSNKDINSIYNSVSAPIITIDENNENSMIVYNDVPEFNATALDNNGNPVEVIITHEIDKNNIGTYIVTYTATDESGNTSSLTKEFDVLKREIEITIDDKTSVYNTPMKELTYTLTGGALVESPEIVLSKKLGNNVGKYPITGRSDNVNYDVAFIDGTYTITKADYNINVVIDDDDLTYNGNEQKPNIDGLTDLPEGVTPTVTYNDEEDLPKDSGEYEVVVEFNCTNDNYNCPSKVEETIKINKANITLKALDKTSVYGDALKDLTYEIKSGEIFESDNLNVVLTSSVYDTVNPTLDADQYDIIINANNSNYNINLVDGTYTITKKGINKPSLSNCINPTGIEFNGRDITLANDGIGYKVLNNIGKDSKMYTITASLDNNHMWKDNSTDDSTFECFITKKLVTITAKDQTITYGNDIDRSLNSVIVEGLIGDDALTSIRYTASRTTAGDGLITVSNAVMPNNYRPGYRTGVLTINRLGIAVPTTETGCNGNLVYTGSNIRLAENKTGYTVTNNTGKNADDYTVTAALDENHKWNGGSTEDKEFTCTIAQKGLTISAKAQEITYGSSIATGLNEVNVEGLVDGETLTGITLTPSITNVGRGVITPSTATGSTIGNYDVVYETGVLTINRLGIAVPTTETGCNGNLVYTGSNIRLAENKTGYTVTNNTGKNADDYTVTAALDENHKWNGGSTEDKEFTCTIAQKGLTISAKAQEITYGSSIATGLNEVNVEGLVDGETLTGITLTPSITNVGRGVITPSTATGSTIGNYDVVYETGVLTINRLGIAVPTTETGCNGNLVYTGSNIRLAENKTGYTVTNNTGKNADDYTVTATLDGNHKWNDGSTEDKEFTCTIAQKGLTISAKAQEITYGSSIATGLNEVNVEGLVDGETLTGITLTPSITNVGRGAITPSTATGSTIGNYAVEYETGVLTINRLGIAAPTTETGCNGNLVYTGSNIRLAENKTGYTVTNNTGKNADDYTVTATLDGNHKWNDGSTEDKEFTCTIAQKGLTISAKAQEITYGSSIATGLNEVNVEGLVDGETLTGITLTPSITNVGRGVITPSTATGSTIGNYAVEYETGVLTINRLGIAVPTTETGCNGNLVYTGSNIRLAENKTGYTVTNNTGKNADDYTVTATLDGNHKWNDGSTEDKEFTCTIAQKGLTISAKAQEITYGSSIATGLNEVNVEGLVDGETLTGITLTPSITNVGRGVITPSTATGSTIGNYDVVYETGVLTINRLGIAVPTNSICNNLTYTGRTLELANSGVGYSLLNNSAINAGDHIVIARLDSNYTWNSNTVNSSDVNITCNIAKANVTVKMDNKTKTYKEANPALTFSVESGLVGGDSDTVISVISSTEATVNSTVGDYAITGDGFSDNYIVRVNPGTLTVIKKGINAPTTNSGCINPNGISYTGNDITLANDGTGYTVTNYTGLNVDSYTVTATLDSNYKWNDNTTTSKTFTCSIIKASSVNPTLIGYNDEYDGEYHSFTVTGGLGGTVKYSTDNTNWSTEKLTRKDVGTTTVYVKVFGDENHLDTSAITTSIVVTKANVTLKADNKEIEFDGTVEPLTYSVTSGEIYNNDITPTLSSTVTAAEPTLSVGEYSITISATNDNYNITLVNGTYKITKKSINIPTTESGCENVVYNGSLQTLANNKTGYSLSNNTGTDADNYIITASLTGNYKWSDNSTTDKTFTCTINKVSIPVVWGNLVFKANGNVQIPSATSIGVNNENISLNIANVEGYDGKSVGTHKAVATTNNTNYTLTNNVVEYRIVEPIVSMNIQSTISRNGEVVTGDTVEYGDIITYTVRVNNTGEVDASVLLKDAKLKEALDNKQISIINNNENITKFLGTGHTLNVSKGNEEIFTFQFKVIGNIGSTLTTQVSYKVEDKDTKTTDAQIFKVETTIDYFEVTSQNKNIVMVLDTSYSMCNTNNGYSRTNCGINYGNWKNSKMVKMQNAAMSFVDTVADGYSNICVVAFPNNYADWQNDSEAENLGCSTNKETVKGYIKELKNHPYTPYGEGMKVAKNLFNTTLNNQNKDYLVFLSDGAPNPLGDAETIATNLKNNGTTIFTIGVEVSDASHLRKMASTKPNSTDKYYFNATQYDLGTQFMAIANLVNTGDTKQTIKGVADISTNINVNKEVKFMINRIGETSPIEIKYNTVALAVNAGYLRYNIGTSKYEIVATKFIAGDKIKFYYYKNN